MTIEQRLVHDLGTTDDPCLAVWLLKDGTWVNGSIEGHQRDVDHHEIGGYFKPSKLASPGSSYLYMVKFMRRGNIRIGCDPDYAYAQMLVPPTRRQIEEILRKFGKMAWNLADVCIERKSSKGNPVKMDIAGFRRYAQTYYRYETGFDAEPVSRFY